MNGAKKIVYLINLYHTIESLYFCTTLLSYPDLNELFDVSFNSNAFVLWSHRKKLSHPKSTRPVDILQLWSISWLRNSLKNQDLTYIVRCIPAWLWAAFYSMPVRHATDPHTPKSAYVFFSSTHIKYCIDKKNCVYFSRYQKWALEIDRTLPLDFETRARQIQRVPSAMERHFSIASKIFHLR